MTILRALVAVISAAFLAQPATIEFAGARWTLHDPAARVVPYLGRPSLFLDRGLAVISDSAFADGTIEFDVAIHGHIGFAGIAFRGQSPDDYELIYLRTHRSRFWDALQYTPIVSGQEAWQLYSGAGYTAPAELPLNRWMHVRVEVDGYGAKVFVDNATQPQLVVTNLRRPWARGFVGLWGRAGAANFSNVTVTRADRPAPVRATSAITPGAITSWRLSPTMLASSVSPATIPDGIQWERVEAEGSGLLDIAAVRKKIRLNDTSEAAKDIVFARATLLSSKAQRVRMAFGYSDEVTILLNGRPIFSGRSGFLARDGNFLGTLTRDNDALYLDLVDGRNELVFAVGERFGGWGLSATLDPAAAVTVCGRSSAPPCD